jgi:ABC-type antimicrobial peptide transport system permease subunit
MSDEFINREGCKECRENFNKRLDELTRITEKRLDTHSNEIVELKILGERLTLVSEQNFELLKEIREKHTEDIKEIKLEIKDYIKTKPNKVEEQTDKKESYWNTEAGKQTPKWIIIGIIAIMFVIVAALVGTNLVELLKAAQNTVPTS